MCSCTCLCLHLYLRRYMSWSIHEDLGIPRVVLILSNDEVSIFIKTERERWREKEMILREVISRLNKSSYDRKEQKVKEKRRTLQLSAERKKRRDEALE